MPNRAYRSPLGLCVLSGQFLETEVLRLFSFAFATFTGMVLALGIFAGFKRLNAEKGPYKIFRFMKDGNFLIDGIPVEASG